MLNQQAAEMAYYGFMAALAICLSHSDHERNETETLEAHDLVVNSALNADVVAEIEDATGNNLNEQLSTEEFADICEHRSFLQMGDARN